MAASRWQKRNSSSLHSGFVYVLGSLFLGALTASLTAEVNWLLRTVLVLATMAISVPLYHYMQRRANSLVRVVKMDYESADFALRRLLSEKNIPTQRQTVDELYNYQFSNRNLSMTLYFYDPVNGMLNITPKEVAIYEATSPKLQTLIELRGVNANNQSFAAMLTNVIDEMLDKSRDSLAHAG